MFSKTLILIVSSILLLLPACTIETGEGTEGSTDSASGPTPKPDLGICGGFCTTNDGMGEYTECTCGADNPCGWDNDGYCDAMCLGIVNETFTDPDCDYTCKNAEWDGVYTYGEDYPDGPYGFKGSLCTEWTGPGEWVTTGDTVPNLCMPNENDEEICMKDYYGSETVDLIILDFSAMWCQPCKELANREAAIIEALNNEGIKAEWITVLAQDVLYETMTAAGAAEWKENQDLSGHVLYDPEFMNETEPSMGQVALYEAKWPYDFLASFPTVYFISTSNMLIWSNVVGIDEDLAAFAADIKAQSEQTGALD